MDGILAIVKEIKIGDIIGGFEKLIPQQPSFAESFGGIMDKIGDVAGALGLGFDFSAITNIVNAIAGIFGA